MGFLSELILKPRYWRLVGLLAWRDSVLSHRFMLLGVIWPFLLTGVLVGFLLAIFGFENGGRDFAVYVASGVLFFQFGVGIVSQGVSTFIANGGMILNMPLPPTVYVWKTLARAGIYALIDVPVVAVCFVIAGMSVSFSNVLVSAAMLMFGGVSLLGLALGLASLAVIVRDLVPAVSAVTRILFFATPIFWRLSEESHSLRALIHDFNPIARFLNLVRDPLLSRPIETADVQVCLMFFAGFWVFGLASYGFVRPRLAAWL
jgi:ABC-type polysaccharide/polyol phosphate export permease